MSLRLLSRTLPLFAVSLLMPLALLAAEETSGLLALPDAAAVSRGDFLRAGIQTLQITLNNRIQLQYRRPVPVSLQPYVKTALAHNALPFGKDLNLAQKITRGEAIQILAGLADLAPARAYTSLFRDVSSDAALQNAVQIAMEEGWLSPQDATTFGVHLSLNAADARALLQAAALSALPRGGASSSSASSVRSSPEAGRRVRSSASSSSAATIRVDIKAPATLPNQDLLQTVWQLLNSQYLYPEKIDAKEAAYGAVEKMVESLKDPYTLFLRPLPAKEFHDQINGQVTGIGAQVEYKDNILTIVAPLSGSPAEKAGLKSGDQILEADGVNITNIGFLEAVNKVRGPKGTSVKLHIIRDGAEMDVLVKRDTITMPEIDVSYQGTIAVVRLTQFGKRTDTDLRKILEDVASRNPTGLILDLRNNPGGLLHAADIVVSNFVPKGSIVAYIMGRGTEASEKTKDAPTIDGKVPMVVLINKGSASAAEITAGALQDYKRATVIGEQSFGKGTVQQILQFRDGAELKMTIAEWLTPLKRKINGIGVVPDILIPAVDGRDDQMLRAIDFLR